MIIFVNKHCSVSNTIYFNSDYACGFSSTVCLKFSISYWILCLSQRIRKLRFPASVCAQFVNYSVERQKRRHSGLKRTLVRQEPIYTCYS